MRHETIDNPEKLARPHGPWTWGAKVGNMVFTSGQAALNAKGEIVGRGDIRAQTRQTLENIKATLEAGGATLDDVVKATIWLTDWRNYDGYNEVYAEYFGPNYPPRATVQSGLALEGLLIEIDAIAAIVEK
ncbi:MAG: RidA family protein [Chloroflexi bacterium]|nr:RidA family protein [Chloroflexota bacterium]